MIPRSFAGPAASQAWIALLLAIAGCSPSPGIPNEKATRVAAVEKPASDDPPASAPLPAAEFQQLPTLPPTEPLPKPAEELNQASIAEPTEPVLGQPTAAIAAEAPAHAETPKPTSEVEPTASQDAPAAEVAAPAVGRPRTGKNSGIPFDPVKENGPVFEGWPKPKAALVITGMEAGYLEPCGCAGMDRMKGGMARRYSMIQQLRRDGWPVVALDVGGLTHGFGCQAEFKFETLVESKRKMGYSAIAFGVEDLRLPAAALVAAAVNDDPSLFVAANVGLFGFDAGYTPKFRIVEAGGVKIGVTAVLGKGYQKEINNSEIEMADPEQAIEKILPDLKGKADYLVLLAHAPMEETVALAKKFPAFGIVVASDGQPEPPKDVETIKGTQTKLITVGQKGANAIVLGLYGAGAAIRDQRVPLDSRYPAAPEMKLLMAGYQDQLKLTGFAGLGLRAVPHPLAETNGRFVGSDKCETCHEKSHKIWRNMGHGRAYDTLAKLDPPRNFDPECLSCHVTGWHPTKFFPYESGFESLEKTPKLINAGCENCHGPGEKHIAAEIGADKALQEKLRKAMVITKAESKKQQCQSCHDIDNSPEFEFDAYWPFAEHYEKE